MQDMCSGILTSFAVVAGCGSWTRTTRVAPHRINAGGSVLAWI